MSLLPWFDDYHVCAPRRRFFDWEPEDLLPSTARSLLQWPGYYRPWESLMSQADAGSTIKFDKDKFQANLDVQQFSPNEISVKTSGDTITIEGKHEEKQDEHGYISRHFVRRYKLPKDHDINRIESKLSSDGVLTITAPRVNQGDSDEKTIPIKHTGKPSKAVEDKSGKKSSKL